MEVFSYPTMRVSPEISILSSLSTSRMPKANKSATAKMPRKLLDVQLELPIA